MTRQLRRRGDTDAGETTPLRALVVDDQESYRAYIASLAASAGFVVTQAADGAEALAVLHDAPPFHLLLVDREMPRITGLQLISAVRQIEQHGEVYAIMITARDEVQDKIAALRLGFDDFIAKSAGEEEIAAKLGAARRLVSRVRELYGMATRDELTGLFNRRCFFSEAERMLAHGEVVNLVFFDLDDFKRVNDTFGHLAGDRILRDIGSLFLRRTRGEDLIARYGGDEFVMLVADLAPDEVEGLADRIAEEIASCQWTFGTESFAIGATTGIACSTLLENPTIAQLLSAGDRDLYKNKWVRKNPDEDPSLYEYDRSREERLRAKQG